MILGILIFSLPSAILLLYLILRILKRRGMKLPKAFEISYRPVTKEEKERMLEQEYSFSQGKIPFGFKFRWLIAIIGMIIYLLVVILLGNNKYLSSVSPIVAVIIEENIRLRYKKKRS